MGYGLSSVLLFGFIRAHASSLHDNWFAVSIHWTPPPRSRPDDPYTLRGDENGGMFQVEDDVARNQNILQKSMIHLYFGISP